MQNPVTSLLSELYLSMSLSSIVTPLALPEMLSVVYAHNDGRLEHQFWVNDHQARELIKAGKARPVHHRRTRILIALVKMSKYGSLEGGSGQATGGTKYTHKHAVEETYTDQDGVQRDRNMWDVNPQGVWAMKHLHEKLRPLFSVVHDECVVPFHLHVPLKREF